ncbi:MAG: general secretion pathway protein GspK [Phycisphaerales bacterium]|nr:MAG: general secretion pathway protein GspK [Phycisphaerales bacterium]
MKNLIVNHKRKGLVLIAVLWTAVVLTVMAAIIGRKGRLDMKVCLAQMETFRCKWAARAGIQKAMAVLKEDDTTSDSLLDLWSDNDEDFNDVLLERCWFSVQVIDEASKLNINTATKEQLLGLPDMVEEIADAIIDWRDTDDTPSGTGVESGYYESMPYLYLARNGPFRTIRELLLVKDVTEELFYGEDTNLNGWLDSNENDGDLSPPQDDADGILDLGWAAYLTCYTSDGGEGSSAQDSGSSGQNGGSSPGQTSGTSGQSSGGSNQSSGNSGQTSSGSGRNSGSSNQASGNSGQTTSTSMSQTSAKINVNTASDIVLAALLGGGDEAERTALAIISYRETLADGIQDISELSEAGSVDSATLETIQDYLATQSNIFTIRCVATADRNGPYGTTLQTEAVVDRSSTPCRILFWYQEGH